MKVKCVWEHNGDDSILYASNFIGAFTRGKSKCEAIGKMSSEISAYLKWKGALTWDVPEWIRQQSLCAAAHTPP